MLLVVFVPAAALSVFSVVLELVLSFLVSPIGIKPDYAPTGIGTLAIPVLLTTAILGAAFWITRYIKDRPLPKAPLPRYTPFEVAELWAAHARAETYERDQHHMCLTFNCRQVVVGEAFAHCNNHLDKYERRWVESGIDSAQLVASSNGTGHNATSGLRGYLERRHARRNAESKKRALKQAKALLDRHYRRTAPVSKAPADTLPTS